MKRLVVLIGVRQPGGGLDELKSIKKCLEDMRDRLGFEAEHPSRRHQDLYRHPCAY